MSLSLRFLGTAASRPTVERNVSSVAVTREGETFLIDCGEGTQRQMMRFGVSFALGDIFFSHLHADHFLGVVGLMRTLSLQGRTDPLRLWAPPGGARLLRKAESFGMERVSFRVEYLEFASGTGIERAGYAIVPFGVDHRHSSAVGFAIVEPPRLGRFDPERARTLGVPEGPMWGQLHRGIPVTLGDGRTVAPDELVGPARAGRTVVITGDTRPCRATIEAARGADLLVHEATFAEEESARAAETGHSTAREAAEVARLASVRRLVLTHFSARYSREAAELEREARAVFRETVAARDGMEVEVEYADAGMAPMTEGSFE